MLGAITVLIMIAVYFLLPEGKRANTSLSLKPSAVMRNFYSVLREPQFLIYAIGGGLATAAPFAYIAGSADVFMNMYKVSERQYGWIFAFLAFAMIGATQLNHILLKKYTSAQIIKVTLWYQSVVGLILVVGTYYEWYTLYSLIGLMFIFLTGQGLSSPNTSALSLAPFSNNAGSASALMGSWRLGAGGIVSAIVSVLHNGTAIPMVGMMAACVVLSLILLHTGNTTIKYRIRKRKRKESENSVLV